MAYSYASQIKYEVTLADLVERMTSETYRKIVALFESPVGVEHYTMDESIASQARILLNSLFDKFNEMFSKFAKPLAEQMVKGQFQQSESTVKNSLTSISDALTLSPEALTPALRESLKAAVTENVGLIKSIASTYFTQIQTDVMQSITTNSGISFLKKSLKEHEGITFRKAKNIALDQTRKIYSNLSAIRCKNLGVKKFEWVHSGGGQTPRQDHIDMDGKIYSFDNLPVIDKRTGERGIPGQAINCGCTMIPVIEFDEG